MSEYDISDTRRKLNTYLSSNKDGDFNDLIVSLTINIDSLTKKVYELQDEMIKKDLNL